MIDKAPLRKHLLAKRDALPDALAEAGSERIRQRVVALPEVAAAASVMVYCSTGSEVRTYTLIEALTAMGKRVSAPAITGPGQMAGYTIESLRDLLPGRFGILTPREALRIETNRLDDPGVVLLPGVAFDPDTLHRLGTGGGFYDRYLAPRRTAFTLGLAFEQQLATRLPAEPHDIPASAIVTPERTIRPPAKA